MKLLRIVYGIRPVEVYILGTIFYVLLFLNPADIADLHRAGVDIEDLFDMDRSIVLGLLRGIGDDYLRADEATLFWWVSSLVYAALIAIKSPQISNWLWSDNKIKPKTYGGA